MRVISTTALGCGIAGSKVHGTNMGPIWGRQDPGGPHVVPMNLVVWDVCCTAKSNKLDKLREWSLRTMHNVPSIRPFRTQCINQVKEHGYQTGWNNHFLKFSSQYVNWIDYTLIVIFVINILYNLRTPKLEQPITTNYGLCIFTYLAFKLWNEYLSDIVM